MIFRLTIFLSVCAMLPMHIFAAEAEANSVLDRWLQEAEANNPGLEAAFDLWQAELEMISQAKGLPNPQISYAYFIDEVETRVGPQEHKFGIAQQLPWFGTLNLKGRVEAARAQAAYESYRAARLQLLYDVKKAFFEYAYLKQTIDITQANVELLSHLESVAQSQYKAGAPVSGVIQAQVELGKLDNQRQSLLAMRTPMSAKLSALMSRMDTRLLPWPDRIPFTANPSSPVDYTRRLLEHNPELKKLETLASGEAEALALAKTKGYPTFKLGVEYIATGEAINPNMADSGKDPLIAMIALDIPLWRGSIRAAKTQAEHRQDAADRALENTQNMLQADLQLALYQLGDTERKIDLYQYALIPKAQEALNVTEEAYRTGAAEFLNLIDAQRMLLEFQLSYERSRIDREIALAVLDRLTSEQHPTRND